MDFFAIFSLIPSIVLFFGYYLWKLRCLMPKLGTGARSAMFGIAVHT